MSDTTPAPKGAKPLSTKRIKRRLEIISTSGKGFAKRRHALAYGILKQIAEGQIKDPVAAAAAYVADYPDAPKRETEGGEVAEAIG